MSRLSRFTDGLRAPTAFPPFAGMTRIRFYGSGPEPNLSRASDPPVNNGRRLGVLTSRSSVACPGDPETVNLVTFGLAGANGA